MFKIVHKAQDHVDNSELYINGLNYDVLKKKISIFAILFWYRNRSQAYTIFFLHLR